MRYVVRLLSVALALAAAPLAPARAFVVENPLGVAVDPIRAIETAPRWDAGSAPFVTSGERGLGGGLEYAVDASVCTALTFVDPAPCTTIRAQIAEAANRWSAGHPTIAFADVSEEIGVAAPAGADGWRGHGAEIDFFAAPAHAFNQVHALAAAADARSYYAFGAKPRAADGGEIAAALGRVTAVDVRFNTGACFYLDPANARDECLHFGSVVLHELAHALGLHHPDAAPWRNVDLDDDPANPIRLDCARPLEGLRASPAIDARAVANSRLNGAAAWTEGLSADDLAGRDALYPACPPAPSHENWAAFALSSDGAFGWATAYADAEQARARALSECGERGAQCRVAAAFTSCFALAQDVRGAVGWAVRVDEEMARAGAEANCRAQGGACVARASFCAAG